MQRAVTRAAMTNRNGLSSIGLRKAIGQCMARCRMTGTNAMRRDLDKRIGDLERVAGRGNDGDVIEVTPELRAAICVEPDDAAALDRLLSGDKSAIPDFSMDALRVISAAGDGNLCESVETGAG